MKYCSACGSAMNDDLRFCSKCGHRFESAMVSSSNYSPSNYSHSTPVDRSVTTLMADRLTAAIPYVEEAVKLGEQIEKDEKWIQDVQKGRIAHSFFKHYSGFLFGGIGMMFAGLMFSEVRYSLAKVLMVIFLLGGLALIVCGLFVARKWVDSRNEALKELAAKKEATVNNNYMRINQLLFSNSTIMQTLDMFPETYWYPFALSKMAEYFTNRRVDSVKEAINLFEEESHRMRLENYAHQQAAQLNSIRRAATISAGANVVNAVNNMLRR